MSRFHVRNIAPETGAGPAFHWMVVDNERSEIAAYALADYAPIIASALNAAERQEPSEVASALLRELEAFHD